MWINRKTTDNTRATGSALLLPIALRLLPVLILLLFAGLVQNALADGSIDELARKGDTAYRDGDYLAAIDAYSRVLSAGYTSGPLLYNLGNAHFKAGHLGTSILYYERALRVMPHNRDVRYNLELAQSRTIDRIDPPPRLPIWNLLDGVRDFVAPKVTAIAAWIIALLAAISFTIQMLVRGAIMHKALRITSISFTVLFVITLSFVGLRIAANHGDPGAIVLAGEVDVHSAPDPTSLKTLTLHEGTKVIVVKELGEWSEVRLADGRQGWLPSTACEII